MKRPNNIHRGELLKKAIAQSDLNITIITKRAGYNRSTYYNHIEQPDLGFHILMKYGRAMNYDFTKDFPGMKNYVSFDEPGSGYGNDLSLEDLAKQRDFWKDKYLQLLEKYNADIELRLKEK